MTEMNLQLIASLKIVWLAIFSFFYGWGGIKGKWKRRFVGSAWMMLGVFAFSQWLGDWSYWYLTYLPLLILCLCLGYGGTDKLIEKIKRRGIYGLAFGITPIVLAIVTGRWILFAIHVFICVAISIILGVFNPTRNAREEETLIATLSGIMPLYII